MPNIIPQQGVPQERDLTPVSSAKSRTEIYGNYKRPIGTALDATLELGYMPHHSLSQAPKWGDKPKKQKTINDIKQKY